MKKRECQPFHFFAHRNRTLLTVSRVSYLKSATPLIEDAAWVHPVLLTRGRYLKQNGKHLIILPLGLMQVMQVIKV